MKTLRYIPIIIAFIVGVLAAACSGSDDGPEGGSELTLTADKTSLSADGSDQVVFTVKYNSEDVSDSGKMHLRYTRNGGTQTDMADGTNAFSTTLPGTYVFTAVYTDGEQTLTSRNSVMIAATGEAQSYERMVLGMQFTSTGCQNCPIMSTYMKLIREQHPGLLAVASFHMNYGNYTDPMTQAISATYANKLNVKSLPQFIPNVRAEKIIGTGKGMEGILESVQQETETAPTCGVAIESSYDANGREVTVEAKVTSTAEDKYRYLIMLVEDDIQAWQLGVDGNEASAYIHNNVVRSVLSLNIYGETLNQGNALTPGAEVTVSRTKVLDNGWNPENMRVIVAILRSSDDGVTYFCDNANECALGQSADYRIKQ